MSGNASRNASSKVAVVRAQVVQLINVMEEGSALPSERELSTAWGVARMTLRRAVDDLVAGGLVVREQGRGAFVTRPKFARHLSMSSFTQEMRKRGFVPSSRLLTFERGCANRATARRLRVPVMEPIVRFVRLRLADDEPIGLESTWVAASFVPGMNATHLIGSWYELLQKEYGLHIATGTSVIESTILDKREAEILHTSAGKPAFRIETMGLSESGRVIDYEMDLFRGDRYRLCAELRPPGLPVARQSNRRA